MKLSQEHIAFIDRYLENSDVIYADIRMEMVDHVASDIEVEMEAGDHRPFYEIFKDYMLSNKRTLLKSNNSFLKAADRKIFKAFVRGALRFESLIVFLLMAVGLHFINEHSSLSVFKSVVFGLPAVLTFGYGIVYLIYIKWKGLERFSMVERLSFPFIFFSNLVVALRNIYSPLQEGGSMTYIIVVL
jgi:hypothetical protein